MRGNIGHKRQIENKQNKGVIENGQSRDIGNIGHKRQIENKQNKGVIRSCKSKKTNDDLQNLVSDKIHTCMSIRKVNRQWRDDRHQVMAKSDKNNILPYFFFDIIIM